MSQRLAKSSKSTAALPADYAPLLADIKARVQSARVKAGLAANRELLALYWDIGRLILVRQRREGWGAKVIDRLSHDLAHEFPDMKGFSPRNLLFMRAFADEYADETIVKQLVSLLPWGHVVWRRPIVQAALAQMLRATMSAFTELRPN